MLTLSREQEAPPLDPDKVGASLIASLGLCSILVTNAVFTESILATFKLSSLLAWTIFAACSIMLFTRLVVVLLSRRARFGVSSTIKHSLSSSFGRLLFKLFVEGIASISSGESQANCWADSPADSSGTLAKNSGGTEVTLLIIMLKGESSISSSDSLATFGETRFIELESLDELLLPEPFVFFG